MEFYPSIDHANKHVLLDLIKPILADLDLLNLETGMHPVNDDLYFNVIQYESTIEDQRVWESHRREYDVHYIISGEERIYHNFLNQMSLGNYDTESDWQEMTGQKASELVLLPGNVLIFDKEDAHKTGLKVTDSVMIKKIVFKIAM
ncbi:YhcH/YjgK/YiaL family protein [Streptococcus pluranimalium]|uniref:YhcH/YjgK/YiaL family protein n=1 Tax=Streptococcus pluranimalium TaxID=82348 RepID=A0A2L0D2B0_9STRE|nr:YhcH/YjgK/YiaL family protein [Streptococcus pluranimalium]AUW95834.1 YhcH/YjgK/YiaL family protein [Streptococcus pluranimalium]